MIVALQAGLGTATADGVQIDAGTLEITLEVVAPPESVVAVHLLEPGGADRTVAMTETSAGRFRTVFETAPIDLVTVFELVGEPGVQSDPLTLTDLGLDPTLLGRLPEAPGALDTLSPPWGWLGLSLGLASLALVAIWFLMRGRRSPDPDC